MDESKYDNNQMMENSMKDEGKMGDTTDQGKGPAAALELEHAIGYSGMVYDSLVYHPNGQDFVYPAGGCLVVCDFNDPHNQVFLRGHDDNLSCVCVSRSGRIAATGQKGLNADVVVWSYGDGNDKSALYRLMIFSDFEMKFLCDYVSSEYRYLTIEPPPPAVGKGPRIPFMVCTPRKLSIAHTFAVH